MPQQSRPVSRDYGALPHVNVNAGAKRWDRERGGEGFRNSTASRSKDKLDTPMGYTPSLSRCNVLYTCSLPCFFCAALRPLLVCIFCLLLCM